MEQVTLKVLLKRDPLFRKWMGQVPKIRDYGRTPPWVVYVQREQGGGWARAEFKKYKKGLKFVLKNLDKYHDMALSHRRHDFKPPRVSKDNRTWYHLGISTEEVSFLPERPTHRWCGYCRRPTVFRFFSKHHSLPYCPSDVRRCTICGASESFVRRYEL